MERGSCMQAAEMEQQFGNSGALASNKAAVLTEMLTQKLLALDNVDTLGDQELRQERKAEINKINRLLDHLESHEEPAVKSSAGASCARTAQGRQCRHRRRDGPPTRANKTSLLCM